MKVAAPAILQAVNPPYLINVVYQIYLNDDPRGRLVVPACFLNTIISIGVTHKAIIKLDASDAIRIFTN